MRFDNITAINEYIQKKTGETREQRADRFAPSQEQWAANSWTKGRGRRTRVPKPDYIPPPRYPSKLCKLRFKLVRELVRPETQLSDHDQKLFSFQPSPLLSTFFTHDPEFKNKAKSDLLFATHDVTNVTFLMDTGATTNLIQAEIAQHCYPEA